MSKAAKLQIIGPFVLVLFVLAAESAAYALSQIPSSEVLWYLNLEVFSVFRKSRGNMGELFELPFTQTLLIAGPLAVLAGLGLALKQKLGVAIASNLSFVYAGFLLVSWYHWQSASRLREASLVWTHVPTGNDLVLFVALLVTCFLSFAASHISYLTEARGQA
jgi:hypothetical protein